MQSCRKNFSINLQGPTFQWHRLRLRVTVAAGLCACAVQAGQALEELLVSCAREYGHVGALQNRNSSHPSRGARWRIYLYVHSSIPKVT